jgi:ankyrin repeat protein
MDVLMAAIDGDVDKVKQWLTAPHTRHPRQVIQVLGKAAEYGHDNICQLMLDSGEAPEEAISLALYIACSYNQQSTAILLVRHGHINIQNVNKALLAACVHSHMNIVEWLISDVLKLSQSDRIKWLLSTACAQGDISDIKQLAAQVDSDVTRATSQALRVACDSGRDDVAKWLMSHTAANGSSCGVLLDADGEMTSLMVACDMGYNSIVRRLLQCVTPHAVNIMSGKMGNTALHFAICCEIEENCPMQTACADSDIVRVTAMLHLSNLDLQVSNDYTALHFACIRGNVEIVRMLLSAFANTHITNDDRFTPTMLAETYGFSELLPHLKCTLSDPPDITVHASNTNNDSVSIMVSSVEDVTQHNTPHTNSRRIGTTTSNTKRLNVRIV